jgi:hypothetical protein
MSGAAEQLEPGQQVGGDGDGMAPGEVDRPGLRRQVAQAGVLAGTYPVLDPGVSAVAGVQQLDRQAGAGVGHEAAVLVAIQLEEGGLFAGGQLGAAHDHAHGLRPAGAFEPLGQQVGDLRDVDIFAQGAGGGV